MTVTTASTRYIFDFEEVAPRGARAAGRQGGRPLRDDAAGASGAGRLHGDDGCLPRLPHTESGCLPEDSAKSSTARSTARGEDRQDVRVDRRPAARLGALRRGDLDARDDGQHPRPRSVRCGGRRARPRDRQRAFRVRLVPPADSDVRRGRRRHRRPAVRGRAARARGRRPRRRGRHRPHRRRPSRARRHATSAIYSSALGHEFPQDARTQLRAAVEAVFRSWQNPRARVYRQLNGIPDSIGTAVNIVQMVFGNAGTDSATGLPSPAIPRPARRTLVRRVPRRRPGRGRRRGHPRAAAARASSSTCCRTRMRVLRRARAARAPLPRRAGRRVHDRAGRLYILQTRSAKRTAAAALKAAVDMAREGLISREEAVVRIEPASLEQLLHRCVDPAATVVVAAPGSRRPRRGGRRRRLRPRRRRRARQARSR